MAPSLGTVMSNLNFSSVAWERRMPLRHLLSNGCVLLFLSLTTQGNPDLDQAHWMPLSLLAMVPGATHLTVDRYVA